MCQRGGVQQVTNGTPLRHAAVHDRDEAIVMVSLQQVCELVDDDVLKALRRLLGELKVDPDSPGFDVAAAPFRLHAFDAPVSGFNANNGLPLFVRFSRRLCRCLMS